MIFNMTICMQYPANDSVTNILNSHYYKVTNIASESVFSNVGEKGLGSSL